MQLNTIDEKSEIDSHQLPTKNGKSPQLPLIRKTKLKNLETKISYDNHLKTNLPNKDKIIDIIRSNIKW